MFAKLKAFFKGHVHDTLVHQEAVEYIYHRTGIKQVWRGDWLSGSIIEYNGWWERFKGHQEFCTCGYRAKEGSFKYDERGKVTNPELIENLESQRSWVIKMELGPKRVKPKLTKQQSIDKLNQMTGKHYRLVA